MSAFTPQSFDIPVNEDLISSTDPKDHVKYQHQLASKIRDISSSVSNGIYGETRKFKPDPRGSGTAGALSSPGTAKGVYVRFGNLVWVSIALSFTDAQHSGTGNLEITGLPVKAYNLTGVPQILPCYSQLSGSQFTGVAMIQPNENYISAVYNAGAQIQINGNDTDLIITGVYRGA